MNCVFCNSLDVGLEGLDKEKCWIRCWSCKAHGPESDSGDEAWVRYQVSRVIACICGNIMNITDTSANPQMEPKYKWYCYKCQHKVELNTEELRLARYSFEDGKRFIREKVREI